MEKFQVAEDKESILKNIFMSLFTNQSDPEQMIEPYIRTIGDDCLQLFYKWLWVRVKQPEIENFGRRFFTELASNDWRYQVNLIKKFMETL